MDLPVPVGPPVELGATVYRLSQLRSEDAPSNKLHDVDAVTPVGSSGSRLVAAASAHPEDGARSVEELHRLIREALGDEEYSLHAPQLAQLGADSLENLLNGFSGNSSMDSAGSPPTDEVAGDRTRSADELRQLLREAIGVDEYSKHAAHLAELGIESLEALLKRMMGAGDGEAEGPSAHTDEDEGHHVPTMPADLAGLPRREPSLEMLGKATTQRRRQGETQEHLLARVTHLHLEGKHLTVLGDLVHTTCLGLRVLYLADNRIHTLGNVGSKLEALHLQGNSIWDLDSWSQRLPHLEILDLGDNRLSHVDGLCQSFSLRKLILRGQRGPGLSFSEATLNAISRSLRILDVAQNGLVDLTCFACLRRLERLDASNNALASLDVVLPVLRSATELQTLELVGNPLCKASGARYRDEVIALAASLQELDGRALLPGENVFFRELNQRRRQRLNSRRRGPSAPPDLGGDRGGDRSMRNDASEPSLEMGPGMRRRIPSEERFGGRQADRESPSSQRSMSERRQGGGIPALLARPANLGRQSKEPNALPSGSTARLPPLLPNAGGGGRPALIARDRSRRQIDSA